MKKLTLITLLAAVGLVGATLVPQSADAEVVPKVRATAGGTLRLDTRLSNGWLPLGKPATVYATVAISGAPAPQSEDRAPLNVALVLDRSTSMSGEKFEQAIEASHTFIDMLGAQDRLAIVSYGYDVTTHSLSLLATDANKELLHHAVNQVSLSGTTNLEGGYRRGVELIKPHSSDTTVNRVILLSDGHANVGLRTEAELGALARSGLNQGVSVTTMGLGLDYNEDIMNAMATQGAGNYYFIEKSAAIANLFRKEAAGLASTVARNTVLELTMAPGVELLALEGFAYTTKGNTATVKLAEFFGEQKKDLLVKLAVSPQASGALNVVTAKLRFDDVTQSDKRVSSQTTLTAVATTDATKLAEVDRDVMRRAQTVETAKSLEQTMRLYEEGKAEQAAQVAAAQRSSNKKFVETYAFEDDAAFQRVDRELEDMQQAVTQAAPKSAAGKRMQKEVKARSRAINVAVDAF